MWVNLYIWTKQVDEQLSKNMAKMFLKHYNTT